MKLGIVSHNTDWMLRADEVARAAEDRGFESLWVTEHTHIPASRATPYPGGGDMPEYFKRMCDPFASLAAAAAVTSTIKLATGICLLTQHDPIVLAKTIATIDQLSGGRFLFGIGAGWNAEEMEHHGTRYGERWRVLRERVEAMKLLWTEGEATYHGEFVHFDRVLSFPKPAQAPHPPVLLGTFASHWGRQRVADYCDGWIPIGAVHGDELAAHIADLRERVAARGRDPDAVALSVFDTEGTPEADLLRYRDMGHFERAIVAIPRVPKEQRDTVLRFLDRYAEIAAKLASGGAG